MTARLLNVRFALANRRRAAPRLCPKVPNSEVGGPHSITSSARSRNVKGNVKQVHLSVFRNGANNCRFTCRRRVRDGVRAMPWFSDDPGRYIDCARNLLHPFGYKSQTYRNNVRGCRRSRRCSWPASMIVQLGTFRSVQRMLRAELWQQQTN
jgi:hypothetical protein